MKAIQIIKPGEVAIVDIDNPVIKSDEVLLKIIYVGFCGSDLSTYLGKNPMVQYPRIPGHEIAAEIIEIGDDVPSKFHLNQKVTVVPYTNCGNCPACKNYRAYACQFNQTLGVQRDGAMCEYIAIPWQKLVIADNLSDLQLAFIEPLTVGFHAIERGNAISDEFVLVFGCGMIGIGAIVGAISRGANVIAVDIDDEKLALARKIGAEYTINSLNEKLHEKLSEITNNEGPSLIIEAAGNPITYKAAIDEVAFTGRVVCIGYAKEEVSFATKLFVQKELDILGSRNATHYDFEAVIEFLQNDDFPVDDVISNVINIDDVSEALRYWSENPGKVIKILLKFD